MLIIQRPTVEAVGEEQNNRQRFAIGPLDPGFGHTLGNSLRRTLLSSIPGGRRDPGPLRRGPARVHHAARGEGGRHRHHPEPEGPAGPGAHRRAGDPAPRQAGPGDATAADLQTTADVEVLNPDLHIASSTPRAAWPSTSPSSGAGATSRPTRTSARTPSGSSRSTPSSPRSAG
jgi:DNA-directed RNA polymerase subunit alpha